MEKQDVEGTLIISNTEDQNPTVGTIRQTRQNPKRFKKTDRNLLIDFKANPLSTHTVICCQSIVLIDNFIKDIRWGKRFIPSAASALNLEDS